ncbi:MAG: Maf family nucleotide pyrophosphatase [Zoogloeaceae bacterium]|jgi:septum formation protein|nr:Maf family nucleotide pyrophosphatase [Zoogloeaceae bacterium]
MPQRHPAPRRVYLASRSPRRRELLAQIGVAFDLLPFRAGERADSEVDETPMPGEAAAEYVHRLAMAKARHGLALTVMRKCLPQPVLAADTALEVNGEIVGKPRDARDAAAILRRLSGHAHRVLTGVAVVSGTRLETALNVSEVFFRPLDEAEIHRYVESGEPMDKAGAYGIQGHAGLFVERIVGSYTGIMGLPLCETGCLLRSFGYAWA